jgi:hypothetical protein
MTLWWTTALKPGDLLFFDNKVWRYADRKANAHRVPQLRLIPHNGGDERVVGEKTVREGGWKIHDPKDTSADPGLTRDQVPF